MKDIAKEAFERAEKDAREKQIEEVKRIVTKTLEKLERVKKDIRELSDKKKILEADLDDLKEGRIDRIVERQEKDPKAKDTSVVIIIKEKEVVREVNPWRFPYRVIWQVPYQPTWTSDTVYGTTTTTLSSTPAIMTCGSSSGFSGQFTSITCSVAKEATVGTYEVEGKVVNFR